MLNILRIMADWLQRLRSKSPKTRKRIALGTSAAITSLVFVMWVTVLNHGFINNSGGQLGSETTQTASPLSAFGSNAASAYREFKEGIDSDDGLSPASSTSSSSPNDKSDSSGNESNYWGQGAGSDSQNKTQVKGETSGDEEPFTSRNYNPNEETDWFSE